MSKKFVPTKVTPEVFNEIKQTLDNYCLSDSAICEIYHIGRTTLGYIKRCHTYRDYVKMMIRKKHLHRQLQRQKLEHCQKLQKLTAGTYTLVLENKDKDQFFWLCLTLACGIVLGYFFLLVIQKGLLS